MAAAVAAPTSALDAWEDPTVQAAFENGEDPAALGADGKPLEDGEAKKKTAARRQARRVTADLLCSENGLEKLAKISRDKNSFKRTRNLAVDVRHLVGMYESWARQLLPTVPFPAFVQQLERLSSNGKIQMTQMQIEQGYEDWAVDADVDGVGADASTAQDDWGDAGGGGADEFEVDLDHEQAMAAAAEAAAAPPPIAASTLSSELQARIAANKAKALERRRAKASAAAAAAPNDSLTDDQGDLPSPEEEAAMMAAASASQPAEAKRAPTSSASSSFSADDELDALMAEEEALGDLMHSEEFRDPERSQPASSSPATEAAEEHPQPGPDNDLDWEARVETDRRSALSFEEAFK